VKISYVTSSFPLKSETFACTDIRALRELGAEVTVHALRARPPGAAALLAERGLADLPVTYNSFRATLGGCVRALRSPQLSVGTLAWIIRHTLRRPGHLVRSVAVLPRCFDILASLERARPDVVHLFWGHYPAIVGRLVQRALPETVSSMFLGTYDLTCGYELTAPVGRAADVVWTHARCNAADIAALGIPAARVALAYRGVDLRLFAESDAIKIGGRIVSAGRLVADKRVDDVLAAFQLVRARRPGASLLVLGEGPDRARLERLARALGIADAVWFRGHVPHTAVRDELRRAQALIAMSREKWDRLPNIVKEAMASRCVPVVAAAHGIDELVADGVTGFIVPPGDVRSAASRIIELIDDPVRANRIGMLAARRIQERFDVRRVMGEYLACWTRHANRRTAGPLASPEPVAAASQHR
jgi:glycosyltransferase involved in cell wall biosynthesis